MRRASHQPQAYRLRLPRQADKQTAPSTMCIHGPLVSSPHHCCVTIFASAWASTLQAWTSRLLLLCFRLSPHNKHFDGRCGRTEPRPQAVRPAGHASQARHRALPTHLNLPVGQHLHYCSACYDATTLPFGFSQFIAFAIIAIPRPSCNSCDSHSLLPPLPSSLLLSPHESEDNRLKSLVILRCPTMEGFPHRGPASTTRVLCM
jgi:hypothetical protein